MGHTTHKIDSARLLQRMRDETARKRGHELHQALAGAFAIPLIAILSTAFLLWMVALAYGGGPTTVTWNQSQDCGSISGWDLLSATITTAQPNPTVTNAVVAAFIANAPPVVCGSTATGNVSLTGVGSVRFWLRSRSNGSPAVVSAASNSVDVVLPLAKPLGLGIAVP